MAMCLFSFLCLFFFLSLSLCRNPEWRCLCWPEQVPVSCRHHPLAGYNQESPGWTAGGSIQQQQQRMWVKSDTLVFIGLFNSAHIQKCVDFKFCVFFKLDLCTCWKSTSSGDFGCNSDILIVHPEVHTNTRSVNSGDLSLSFIHSVCLAVIWRLNHKALDQRVNLSIVVGWSQLQSKPHGAAVHCVLCKAHWIWQLIWRCPPSLKTRLCCPADIWCQKNSLKLFSPSLDKSFTHLTGKTWGCFFRLSVWEHFGVLMGTATASNVTKIH